MNTKTLNRELTDAEVRWLHSFYQKGKLISKVLHGGRALGLEMLDLDVIRGTFYSRHRPSLRAYSHGLPEKRTERVHHHLTVMQCDEDRTPVERLQMSVRKKVDGNIKAEILDRAEVNVLSPADTALELTEEDVEPLEEVSNMYTAIQCGTNGPARTPDQGTVPFLEGTIGEEIELPGCGVMRNGSLYVLRGYTGATDVIREDGTILRVGWSVNDSRDHDRELEKMIRPRIEDLRN